MALKLISKSFEFLQRIKFKLGIDRKSFVLRHIKENKCRNILEIGVFNGNFALRIIATASEFIGPQAINYSGVDLFKFNFSNEIKFNEIALTPDKKSDVQKILQSTGANINLFEGFSNLILPQLVSVELFDLIIIDGGHSYDTVKSDFLNSNKLFPLGAVNPIPVITIRCVSSILSSRKNLKLIKSNTEKKVSPSVSLCTELNIQQKGGLEVYLDFYLSLRHDIF
jgi:hypothetical protein